MSAQHTPGPWTTRLAKDASGDVGILARACCVAECFSDIRRVNEQAYAERDANARLIAAAPDLLAAAKHAEKILAMVNPNEGYPGGPLQQLRAAIAKAEGKS